MPGRLRFALYVLSALLAPSQLTAQGPAFVESKWPQPFTLEPGDHASFGFAVGAPGAIVAAVEARGGVVVTITRPNGTVAKEASGAGAVRVEYVATAADVTAGPAWRVTVGDAAPPMRGMRMGGMAAGSISGTVAVQHPAAGAAKVALMASPRPARGAPSKSELDASIRTLGAAYASKRAGLQAARMRELQAKLPPAAFQKLTQGMAGRVGAVDRGGVSTSQSASTGTGGAAPVGGNQPQSVAATPTVNSLDVSFGKPGDQVVVTGSGFGAAPAGEVHFMVAPGKDLAGTVNYWSDGQIVVGVPDISGVRSFSGQMYVRRGTVNSRLVPFRFEPDTEYAVIPIGDDRQQDGGLYAQGWNFIHEGWPGIKGNDEFFLHASLKNGWVLDDAYVVPRAGQTNRAPEIEHGKGDAYVSEAALGTGSPRIKVHWWGEVNSLYLVVVNYWPVLIARGPKGLPCSDAFACTVIPK